MSATDAKRAKRQPHQSDPQPAAVTSPPDAWLAYLEAQDVQVHRGIRFQQDGNRGVEAVEDIPAGSALISIPCSLIFTLQVAKDTSIVKKILSEATAPVAERLLLYAGMIEHSLDPSSPYHGYFDHLPTTFTTPMWWPAKERELLLAGTNLGKALPELVQQEGEFCRQAADFCGDPSKFSAQAFARCHAWVQSRAFNVNLTLPQMQMLAPGHGGSGGVGCLLPALDMFNHHHEASMLWHNTGQRLIFSNVYALQCGQEIFNNYGYKGNEELLAGYGFALQHNPYNTFAVRVRWFDTPNLCLPLLQRAYEAELRLANTPSALAPEAGAQQSPEAGAQSSLTAHEATTPPAGAPGPSSLRFSIQPTFASCEAVLKKLALIGENPQALQLMRDAPDDLDISELCTLQGGLQACASLQSQAAAMVRQIKETQGAADAAGPSVGKSFALLYRQSQLEVAQKVEALAAAVATRWLANEAYEGFLPHTAVVYGEVAHLSHNLRVGRLEELLEKALGTSLQALVRPDVPELSPLSHALFALCLKPQHLGDLAPDVDFFHRQFQTEIDLEHCREDAFPLRAWRLSDGDTTLPSLLEQIYRDFAEQCKPTLHQIIDDLLHRLHHQSSLFVAKYTENFTHMMALYWYLVTSAVSNSSSDGLELVTAPRRVPRSATLFTTMVEDSPAEKGALLMKPLLNGPFAVMQRWPVVLEPAESAREHGFNPADAVSCMAAYGILPLVDRSALGIEATFRGVIHEWHLRVQPQPDNLIDWQVSVGSPWLTVTDLLLALVEAQPECGAGGEGNVASIISAAARDLQSQLWELRLFSEKRNSSPFEPLLQVGREAVATLRRAEGLLRYFHTDFMVESEGYDDETEADF